MPNPWWGEIGNRQNPWIIQKTRHFVWSTGFLGYWRTTKQPETLIIRANRLMILFTVMSDVTLGSTKPDQYHPLSLALHTRSIRSRNARKMQKKLKKQWIVHHHWLGILKQQEFLRDQMWVNKLCEDHSSFLAIFGIACCCLGVETIQWLEDMTNILGKMQKICCRIVGDESIDSFFFCDIIGFIRKNHQKSPTSKALKNLFHASGTRWRQFSWVLRCGFHSALTHDFLAYRLCYEKTHQKKTRHAQLVQASSMSEFIFVESPELEKFSFQMEDFKTFLRHFWGTDIFQQPFCCPVSFFF